MSYHAISRTSPKGAGQKFIGTCFKCGTKDLPAEAVSWKCENPANLTRDESLMIAIKGQSHD